MKKLDMKQIGGIGLTVLIGACKIVELVASNKQDNYKKTKNEDAIVEKVLERLKASESETK